MAVTSGCVGVPMMSRCLPASSACRAITWIFLTKGHVASTSFAPRAASVCCSLTGMPCARMTNGLAGLRILGAGDLTQAHGLEALDDVAVVDDRPERHGRRAGLRGLLRQAHGPLHAEAEARRLS